MVSTSSSLFLLNDPATTKIYTLSLHDALPILWSAAIAGGPGTPPSDEGRTPARCNADAWPKIQRAMNVARSEEHTSELQSRGHLVCRLLLEKKKMNLTRDEFQHHAFNLAHTAE